ncbi:MAG TPA: hypothetical protein VIO58_05565 [Candidatus Methanoperedens sp.]
MTGKVAAFKKEYSGISSRVELLKLEDEIKEFMQSKDFKTLSNQDMNALDDLLIDVINKKEYLQTGLDPGKMKKSLNDSKWRNKL